MKRAKWALFIGLGFMIVMAALALAKTPNSVKKAKLTYGQGEKLYDKHCATCHGVDLNGGMAESLADGQWAYAQSSSEIKALIKNGNADVGMPAFKDQLSNTEINALHTFIKTSGSQKKITAATQAVQAGSDLLNTEVWVEGLDTPWGLVFTGEDTALVTEKNGNLYEIVNGKLSPTPITGLPMVNSKGQGGLMDIAIDPDFSENGWVYLSFSHQLETGPVLNMTKIIRGHIKDGKWQDEQILFAAKPEHYIKTSHHYGSRITFDGTGHMFFSIGDRGQKDMAQDITRPNGKIHRLMRDGSIPKDNPFVNSPKAYHSIFSYGNRNPQGLVYAGGKLWETEHGPKGGDELNLIRSGVNYGWPVISYGRNYSGTELTPYTNMEGMEQPVSQWTPSIAACGLDVVSGEMFTKWDGYLLAGALKFKELRLIKLQDGKYVSEQILLKDKGRVRDVTIGSDGAIYVVLNRPGQILRLTPGQAYGAH